MDELFDHLHPVATGEGRPGGRGRRWAVAVAGTAALSVGIGAGAFGIATLAISSRSPGGSGSRPDSQLSAPKPLSSLPSKAKPSGPDRSWPGGFAFGAGLPPGTAGALLPAIAGKLGLGFGVFGPLAANAHAAPVIAGTVVSDSGSTIVVKDLQGFDRTIFVSSSTKYHEAGASATAKDVTVGTDIVATGKVDSNKTALDASSIEVVQPTVIGTVSSISSGSFKVTGMGDQPSSVSVATNSSTVWKSGDSTVTSASLKKGDLVFVVAKESAGGAYTAVTVYIGTDKRIDFGQGHALFRFGVLRGSHPGAGSGGGGSSGPDTPAA